MHAGEVLWSFVHVVSWSTYLGGTIVMELVWRPAQQVLPPSQTAVACQWMGRRYRWVALVALLGAGASGAARLDGVPDLATDSGRLAVVAVATWLVLLAVLGLLALVAHPALHVRTSTEMTEQERTDARQRVHRSIRRMDRVLRLELALALVAALVGVLQSVTA